MMSRKFFTSSQLRAANEIAAKRGYNRQLVDEVFSLGFEQFPVLIALPHDHAAGVAVDTHMRCMVGIGSEMGFVDCDAELFESLDSEPEPPKPIELGYAVATAAVDQWLSENADASRGVQECLKRHARRDWGEVCDADKKLNDEAATREERLLSAYTVAKKKIWIITEADRSSTTILFPEEY